MGKLSNNFAFTGGLGHLPAYTMRGHDGIILRTRGAPPNQRLRTPLLLSPPVN
ncbi:MAG TPA: hypothetical protein VFC34_07295 [Puia sp.]|nr:hypothetical protein [Puia sp.]